ncbi:MAG: PIG-L deacetylase family protein [Chloroflexota bacterium]
MSTETAQVLVITPHPDDAEIGMGGTIARFISEGKTVVYIVCTNGDKGSSDPSMTSEKLAQTREDEQLAAARALGVKEVIFLRHPDQGLEDTPDFRKEFVHYIRLYRPDIVATTNPYRHYIWHRDHRITGQVVLDAIFPSARDRLAYPDMITAGLEPHKVKEVLFWGSEEPNCFMDISATIKTKITALSCHKSQLGNPISPEMIKRMIQRAKDTAEGQPFALAEAFYRVEIRR